VFACWLVQINILSPVDSGSTVVYPKLVVDIFGVGTHGVQRDHEGLGNFWSVQFSSEQPQHFKFTFAQGFN